ncbi:PAM68 family protein [Ancylothrix sp. C2]|uniref:PAM68 family protein n=1 Tax=Ancylothrix sp. D3o TaxID=2953691 RepID=UPI0021BB3B70|nr:PAM68 family protein [Ancylothrix sp. D3o]MCT7951101.1 PAM68 family protein [Ancylothrix sp. D3o]
MASETDERSRLPFEPAKNRKKSASQRSEASPTPSKEAKKKPNPKPIEKTESKSKTKQPVTKAKTAVPEAVSRRMISRMAVFSGLPTFLGIATFVASYFVITNNWYDLPNSAVVLVSMAFFGIGVLGLSYGVISASWDEEIPGSALGWKEFTTNFERLTAAWRTAGKKDTET